MLTRADGRGVHHRAADRVDHVPGGVLAYLVLIPAIKLFGEHLPAPLAPETDKLIADMKPNEIPQRIHPVHRSGGGGNGRDHQHAAGAMPTIAAAFARGLGSIAAGKGAGNGAVERTERETCRWGSSCSGA